MNPYYQNQGVTIYHGDCREVLAGLEPETFTVCITDPFAGSGPLAYVAAQMGVRATLIEKEEQSAELCALRLQGQQSLFGGA